MTIPEQVQIDLSTVSLKKSRNDLTDHQTILATLIFGWNPQG